MKEGRKINGALISIGSGFVFIGIALTIASLIEPTIDWAVFVIGIGGLIVGILTFLGGLKGEDISKEVVEKKVNKSAVFAGIACLLVAALLIIIESSLRPINYPLAIGLFVILLGVLNMVRGLK